jgi:hypothetical protein
MKTKKAIRKAYWANRAKYPTMSAAHCLSWAKAVSPEDRFPQIAWRDDSAAGRLRGPDRRIYDVAVKVSFDDCPDTSWLGKYSNSAGEDAIDRKANGDQGRNEYRYWNPCNTYASHYNGLRKLYFGRHGADCLARSYVLADYKRHERLNAGGWAFVNVEVTVSKDGIELASECCGGAESDSDYWREVASDMIPGALKSAAESIAKLCAVK